MASNKFKRTGKPQAEVVKTAVRSKMIMLQDTRFLRHWMPIIGLATLFATINIANHHYGEQTIVQIDKTRSLLKDLHAESQTANARLSKLSMQSSVARRAKELGLIELTQPPRQIPIGDGR